jgi:formimidoylglutamate deiminase
MDSTDHAAPQRLPEANIAWIPDLIYVNGRFQRDTALVCDSLGQIVATVRLPASEKFATGDAVRNVVLPSSGLLINTRFVRLRGRAMLPGLVNAHSHAFQRVIRGRTEYRTSAAREDSFWTWREMMYSAASRLTPADIYDASRMAFLEMSLSGITAVGEFHYLHRPPAGDLYDDPNLLSKEVVRAARDVGVRIALLRVAYARSGYNLPPDPQQSRFVEPDAATYLRHVEQLMRDIEPAHGSLANEASTPTTNAGAQTQASDADAATDMRFAWVGVAPHSIRAVPLPYLHEVCEFAGEHRLPVHMHVAEQRAEVAACLAEHGRTPVALLAGEGLLSARFTGVHAVHITDAEARSLAAARASVCACPTTERNLGDGIIPADALLRAGVRLALGTDSHTQIDLLEDARELEYHLRLDKQQRNVLAPYDDDAHAAAQDSVVGNQAADKASADETSADKMPAGRMSALAARLFACATTGGAQSIGATGGALEPGSPADFFTVALEDPSIAGAREEDLLSAVLFSLARTALRDVAVGGRLIVEDGRHLAAEEIVERFKALQRRLWNG